jgi:hypothetical protein
MKKIQLQTLVKVTSSNIDSIGYEGDTLFVQFKSGTVYSYSKVDANTFNNMTKSESVGKYLNGSIKGNFEYNKLEDVELEQRKKDDKASNHKN